MLTSVLELVKIVSEYFDTAKKTIYEFGSRQVEGGGGEGANLRGFFPESNYIGVDIKPGRGVDALYTDVRHMDGHLFDGETGPLADIILCLEVLEHAPDPEDLLTTITNISSPKGWTLFTTPFHFPVHSKPDYRRYTPEGLGHLLRGRFNHVYVLPTLPAEMPITSAALCLNGQTLSNDLKTKLEDWCLRWRHPISPASGETVLLCSHAAWDPSLGTYDGKGLGWSMMAQPVALEAPGGRRISSRWAGMCAACRNATGDVFDVTKLVCDGVWT